MMVGTAALKNNLSRYLKRARAGQPVIVTDRGRPVAKLVPIRQGEATDVHETLAALAASGAVTYPSVPQAFRRVSRVAVPQNAASALVCEHRR